jgi:site-specific recombinase XerD
MKDQPLLPARVSSAALPALVAASGPSAARRFVDFFASNIRNRHTREAYAGAVNEFLRWCQAHAVPSLAQVESFHVAAWIEAQAQQAAAPTVKQRSRRHPPSL